MNPNAPDDVPDDMVLIAPCIICGWKSLTQGRLCLDCREIRQWSTSNRAFCTLLHRDSPYRRAHGPLPA